MLLRRGLLILLTAAILSACSDKQPGKLSGDISSGTTSEKYRPEFHFTPDSMWMNDPNGLVYHAGTYHLFYQYYPDSTVWGPMHWGHATSENMLSWTHQPVALYPDDLGYIFSGSAVYDIKNTSGFGTEGNPPLIAIFTYHDPVAAENNPLMSQSQGIAYSLDSGKSWEKYAHNPVLESPGINDFRDPKVRWYAPEEKWIMILAVKDHIRLYSSKNLKEWKLESEFRGELGAHGGVWECPDLFPLSIESSEEEYWILIVSLNPGGPNGGSGTQYFIGQFDGQAFTPKDEKIRWLDYGPDDYAGVTWSNTGDRTLFLGWMSNWKYAQLVPTERWRSAMTIPRELMLVNVNEDLVVSSMPVPEFDELDKKKFEIPDFEINGEFKLSNEIQFENPTFEMELSLEASDNFEIHITNDNDNKLSIKYLKQANTFTIDRSKTGDSSFHPEFGKLIEIPRIETEEQMDLHLVVDVASLELFADNGTTVATVIFFPERDLSQIVFRAESQIKVDNLVLKDIL